MKLLTTRQAREFEHQAASERSSTSSMNQQEAIRAAHRWLEAHPEPPLPDPNDPFPDDRLIYSYRTATRTGVILNPWELLRDSVDDILNGQPRRGIEMIAYIVRLAP